MFISKGTLRGTRWFSQLSLRLVVLSRARKLLHFFLPAISAFPGSEDRGYRRLNALFIKFVLTWTRNAVVFQMKGTRVLAKSPFSRSASGWSAEHAPSLLEFLLFRNSGHVFMIFVFLFYRFSPPGFVWKIVSKGLLLSSDLFFLHVVLTRTDSGLVIRDFEL